MKVKNNDYLKKRCELCFIDSICTVKKKYKNLFYCPEFIPNYHYYSSEYFKKIKREKKIKYLEEKIKRYEFRQSLKKKPVIDDERSAFYEMIKIVEFAEKRCDSCYLSKKCFEKVKYELIADCPQWQPNINKFYNRGDE